MIIVVLGIISFGMPTLIETSTLEECAKLCAELGLDFIELNMNLPQYQIPKIDIAYFKSIADKYRGKGVPGVRVTSLRPVESLDTQTRS